jgi:hypothetical protein
LSTVPVLGEVTQGDTLELSPSGSWTAAYAAPLENLFDAVSPKLQRAKALKIDMADVRELDTLGAWLKLDKPDPASAVSAFDDAFGSIATDLIIWTAATL